MGALRVAVASAVLLAALFVPASAAAAPGDRDPGFGERGIATPPGGAVYAAAGTADGGTVLLLSTGAPGQSPLEVRKVTASGEADASFGGDGIADLPAALAAVDLAVSGDGRILVGGFTQDPGPSKASAARLLADGSIDPSFGSDGVATLSLPGERTSATAIVTEPDGGAALSITVLDAAAPPVDPSAGVLRFTSDGTPDPTFGGDGVSNLEPGSAGPLVRDGSGRYLLGNSYYVTGGPTVTRYGPNGDLDGSFGSGGVADLPVHQFGVFSGGVNSIAIDAAGRIMVFHSGWDLASTKGGGYSALDRLAPGGAVDDSFDASEIFAASRKQHRIFRLSDLAIDAAGRIVLAGGWKTTSYTGSAVDPAVARLLPNGSPDESFGESGLAIVPALELKADTGFMSEVYLRDGGRIMAVGARVRNNSRSPALVRMLAARGRADADADGIADRRDRCALTAGRRREDGCPLLQRRVKIVGRANDGFYNGAVIGLPGCANKVPVKLMRIRPGRDEVVGRDRTGNGGWSIAGDFPIGRYYAFAPRRRNGDVGICMRARSRIAR